MGQTLDMAAYIQLCGMNGGTLVLHTKCVCVLAQIQEALDCMPSLLTLDDLHLICPAPGDSLDNANAGGSAALVEWLCDVLDSFRPPGKPMLPGMQLSLTCPPAPPRHAGPTL